MLVASVSNSCCVLGHLIFCSHDPLTNSSKPRLTRRCINEMVALVGTIKRRFKEKTTACLESKHIVVSADNRKLKTFALVLKHGQQHCGELLGFVDLQCLKVCRNE